MGGKHREEWSARPHHNGNNKILHQPASANRPLAVWVSLTDAPKAHMHRDVRVTIPPELYDHLYGLLSHAICVRDGLLPPEVLD